MWDRPNSFVQERCSPNQSVRKAGFYCMLKLKHILFRQHWQTMLNKCCLDGPEWAAIIFLPTGVFSFILSHLRSQPCTNPMWGSSLTLTCSEILFAYINKHMAYYYEHMAHCHNSLISPSFLSICFPIKKSS